MSNVIFKETADQDNPKVKDAADHDSLKVIDSPYRRYSCQEGNPLGCSFLKEIAQTDSQVQICPVCTFPSPLPDNAEIQGKNGIYRLDAWLGKRGLGRLYLATLLGLNQRVVIKEYLLPQLHFSAAEIRERQQTFVEVAGLSLADGRVQDFRVLTILEAIPDVRASRCYLVLETTAANSTLRQYLQQGAFSENQVYQVLQQVLQSLKFLHSQRFRLPSGQMTAGLVHGSLSLDSLLMSVQPMDLENPFVTQAQRLTPDQDFFLYLCDLTLWEALFLPSLVQTQIHSQTDDLVALGTVAFELLTADIAKETGKSLDPAISQHWPVVDPKLKQFILRLLRLEQPFESADAALQDFYRFAFAAEPTPSIPLEATLAPTRKKRVRLRWILLLTSLLLLGLLGWLAIFCCLIIGNHRPIPSRCYVVSKR